MPVDHPAEDDVAVTLWCAICGCEFRHIQSKVGARAEPNPVTCQSCQRMSNDGIDVSGNPELMRELAQRNVRLHRLPGGFYRVLPRVR